MPKQVGLIKVRGTVEDLSFFETQDGFMAKKKARFSKDRLKTDPNYEQVRLNNLEFGTGGAASRLFRDAFTAEINKASDNRMISRLTTAMIAVLRADTINPWGYRTVQQGDMQQLEGFNFNDRVSMSAAFKVESAITLNRGTGQAAVIIPAHIPKEFVAAPSNGVSHYRLFAAAAILDFENESSFSARQSSANLVYDDNLGTETTLTLPLTANSTLPCFIVLGVQFMKIVNGKAVLNSKKESSLHVLAIDVP
jgi:hypothetical protein